ncbi:hypothetical protein B296_00004197 [Ensete ventricosum]|uniref:Uncharacterized protein n=1 Tax=Ensete ventricosum TaxID=4639 RepID=A0A426XW22_ENSVE|nr:hypothetical protein B296_00004197 [Ensete ventricosum]
MARPPTGVAAMAWLSARGGYPRAWPAVTSPAASRGGDACCRGGRPLAGRLSAVTCAGAATVMAQYG